ncbi:MAG: hypothetical protein OXC07_02825, partial [Kistimonas sp.]|nr:hypothetical protein [Kistimonas sp.]
SGLLLFELVFFCSSLSLLQSVEGNAGLRARLRAQPRKAIRTSASRSSQRPLPLISKTHGAPITRTDHAVVIYLPRTPWLYYQTPITRPQPAQLEPAPANSRLQLRQRAVPPPYRANANQTVSSPGGGQSIEHGIDSSRHPSSTFSNAANLHEKDRTLPPVDFLLSLSRQWHPDSAPASRARQQQNV